MIVTDNSQTLANALKRIEILERENKLLWESKTVLSAHRLGRIKYLKSQITLWRGKFEMLRRENNQLRKQVNSVAAKAT